MVTPSQGGLRISVSELKPVIFLCFRADLLDIFIAKLTLSDEASDYCPDH